MADFGFLWGILNILLIDITLAGDNALVIASATKRLHGGTRTYAIVFGAAAAALLRIAFLFVASWLLSFEYLFAVGGVYIVYLSIILLRKEKKYKAQEEPRSAEQLARAIWIVASADVLMSLDNVLAVAGAAAGNYVLFIVGVLISIPIVFAAASFLSRLMERYPIVILIGSLVLARVGGDMIAEDQAFAAWFEPWWTQYSVQAAAVAVTLCFYFIFRAKKTRTV